METEEEERPEFFATDSRVMDLIPGNFDHAEGEPVIVMTVAHSHNIVLMAFPLADAKPMITLLLVSLATFDDEFARGLLDDHFGADANGNYVWPKQ